MILVALPDLELFLLSLFCLSPVFHLFKYRKSSRLPVMKAFRRCFFLFTVSIHFLSAEDVWRAFNDSVDTEPDASPANITSYGLGRGYDGDGMSGELLDFDTGAGTGVTVELVEKISEGNTINFAADASEYVEGSDAAALFEGAVNLSGNMSYNDAPGWHMDTIFAGLKPGSYYTFAATVNRNGGEAYRERVTNWSIHGVDAFVYASSEGAHKVSDDSVEFSSGENSNGYVAKWVDIRAGEDGTFLIRSSHSVGEENGGLSGAHGYKGYAGGVFFLSEQTGPVNQAATPAVEVFRLTPGNDEDDAHPNSPVQVVLKHSGEKADPDSITLTVDGNVVTPTITANENETRVFFSQDTLFASNSTHSATIAFDDMAEAPASYEKSWSFTVEDYSDKNAYPTIPATAKLPDGSLTKRRSGFAMRLAAPDIESEVTVSSVEEAEEVWEKEYENLADTSEYNPSGYFIEGSALNHQTDGMPRGNKAGEQRFPGIESSEVPGSGFAVEAVAWLSLRPGFHTLNVTVDTEFEIHLGSGANETKLPRVYPECTNCGGEDAAWIVNFIIEEQGLYPIRLVYFNDGGSGSLELLELAPDGTRHLINGGHPDSIVSYVPPELLAAPLELVAFTVDETGHKLQFRTPDPSGNHEIQISPDLSPGSWSAAEGVMFESDGENLQATVSPEAMSLGFYRVALLPPPPVFYDDFESGVGDWNTGLRDGAVATETEWKLGPPAPASGLVDGAYSGTQCWGTSLEDTFATDTQIYLRSPVIDLTGVRRPRLRFRYAVDATEGVEGGRINFRDENGTLLEETDYLFWGQSNGWQEFDGPVPVNAREQKVIIEFEFLSDSLGPNGEGWFVDDVEIGR